MTWSANVDTQILCYLFISTLFISKATLYTVFRKKVTTNGRLPNGKVDWPWEISKSRTSSPNAQISTMWPPPANRICQDPPVGLVNLCHFSKSGGYYRTPFSYLAYRKEHVCRSGSSNTNRISKIIECLSGNRRPTELARTECMQLLSGRQAELNKWMRDPRSVRWKPKI